MQYGGYSQIIHHKDTNTDYCKWGWGFPWRGWNHVYTTYRDGGFMWQPNTRIDFCMKLTHVADVPKDGNQDKDLREKNTSAWSIAYYEDEGFMFEIDIMEIRKYLNKFLFHVHTNYGYKKGGVEEMLGGEMRIPKRFDFDTPHLFSVKWVDKKILGIRVAYLKWYLDGVPVQYVFRRIPHLPVYPAVSHIDLNDLLFITILRV